MSELVLPTTTVPNPLSAPGLRWGVIAPGRIASSFIATMHAATQSQLVAVCSRSRQRAEEFAQKNYQEDHASGPARAYDSLSDFLADPDIDAVYVASPHAMHAQYARPVVDAGIPVVVEKAFTLNSREAIDLLSRARDNEGFVMEAMWPRFLPHYDVIRQAIAQGMICLLYTSPSPRDRG